MKATPGGAPRKHAVLHDFCVTLGKEHVPRRNCGVLTTTSGSLLRPWPLMQVLTAGTRRLRPCR
jgi:hypothetical protein